MKDKIKQKNIFAIISAVMLFLAIPPLFPYGYYQILRWVITASAIYIAYLASELKINSWMWLMAFIAVLFNPLLPIYLNKATWAPIDFIVAIIFLISLKIKNN